MAVAIERSSRLLCFSLMSLDMVRATDQAAVRNLRAFHVDLAPNAPLLARTEPNDIAKAIQALADSIDPAEAERFIDRLWPGNARFT